MDQLARKILALDQSSRTTGWAVFHNNQLYEYGHFSITDDDIGVRLNKIRDKVATLISDYDINEIVFEDIQLQDINNPKVFKILAEVFGVIYELATDLQISNTAVSVNTWRSGLAINHGGKRASQKERAKEFVLQHYNIKPTEDECDAICIGAYAVRSGAPATADFNWE